MTIGVMMNFFFDFDRVVNLYNELVSWTLSIISFM
jgi:hypothetical protein